MTKASTYNDLADKVEAARGADRSLDVQIALSVQWDIDGGGLAPFHELADKFGDEWALETATSYTSVYRCLPNYTASIDAALTLVPEGWRAAFEQGAWNDLEPDKTEAWVWPFESSYDPDWQMGQETQHSNPDRKVGFATTPALALVAASLRAHAQGEG